MKICVMSRGGRGGKDDPYVFHLGQRRLPVVAIVSEWLEPPCRCFLVRVDDGRRFVLRHDPATGDWQLAAAYGGGSRPAATARL